MISFGAFRLDPDRECLTYRGEYVALPDRLFEILLALVRANGAVVTREELYGLVWPDGGVPENNLSQHVYMLRRRLRQCAGDSVYVATVHGRGFRFVPPVRTASELFAESAGLDPVEFVPALAELARTHLRQSAAK